VTPPGRDVPPLDAAGRYVVPDWNPDPHARRGDRARLLLAALRQEGYRIQPLADRRPEPGPDHEYAAWAERDPRETLARFVLPAGMTVEVSDADRVAIGDHLVRESGSDWVTGGDVVYVLRGARVGAFRRAMGATAPAVERI